MLRRCGLALVTIGALSVLAGCGASDGSGSSAQDGGADTFTAKGAVTLIDSGIIGVGGGQCVGMGGYDDMRGGTQVVVKDGDGTKVAIGELAPGRWGDSKVTCIFDFTVEDVPTGGGVYSVEVSHRGDVSFKQADAEDLALSLG